MASKRQQKKNQKTSLIRLNKKRIDYLNKLATENRDIEAKVKELEKKLKEKKKKLEALKKFSIDLDHEVKAAAREVAQKEAQAIKSKFQQSWIGKLDNQHKNQAIRLLHDKGIKKAKSEAYEDFLLDNEEELSLEEIKTRVEEYAAEISNGILDFSNKMASMDAPFKNFKKRI